MSLRLGDKAPSFKAVTTLGEIDFYEYPGASCGILLSPSQIYSCVYY